MGCRAAGVFIVGLLLGAVSVPRAAAAETLVATHPGLMCRSAYALAILTLPDGSSRVGTALEKPDDVGLKAADCIDIPLGAKVTLLRRQSATSIVTYDSGTGDGRSSFVVANSNFGPAPNQGVALLLGDDFDRFSAAVAAACPSLDWARANNNTYRKPLGAVVETMPITETGAMNKFVGQACKGDPGRACINEVSIAYLVRLGHLDALVDAFCMAPPD